VPTSGWEIDRPTIPKTIAHSVVDAAIAVEKVTALPDIGPIGL
jgi:hypothetical protein